MNDGSVREAFGRINVFISHAGEDIDLARALQSSIESVCGPDNVDVFLDYDKISFGSEIPEVIKDALRRSSFFIGVRRKEATKSLSRRGHVLAGMEINPQRVQYT
jgi:hypothetical protein